MRELLCEASRRADVAKLVLDSADARAHPAEARSLAATAHGPPLDSGSAVVWPLQPLPLGVAGQLAFEDAEAVRLPGGHASPGRLSPRRHPVPVKLSCQAGGQRRAANSRRAAQVAQLADEAAEAVHLLDGVDEPRRQAGLPLVLDALDKVAAKAEGLLRAGQGPLALEALVAVTGEVVRPDEVPRAPCTHTSTLLGLPLSFAGFLRVTCSVFPPNMATQSSDVDTTNKDGSREQSQGFRMHAEAVWSAVAGSGVLGRLAFATERAIPLCPPCVCQVPVDQPLFASAAWRPAWQGFQRNAG